jgi:hypothetical protein
MARGWRDGVSTALPSNVGWVGRRSGAVTLPIRSVSVSDSHTPAATATAVQLFVDTENHVLMAERAPEPPFILAGSRTAAGGAVGGQDGTGVTATFCRPAAVAWSGSALYVADYESNRIRQVTLPGWVFTTGTPDSQNR